MCQSMSYFPSFQVIVSTADKAPTNMRFVSFHRNGEIRHKAKNLFAKDRWVFFISDAPHLLKTIRNNVEASKNHYRATRKLWVGVPANL